MTGNTKVWRAPLAGLASFAMIATMGLAAGTAAAADRSVTLNANGGSYTDGTTSQTLKDSDNTPKFENLYAGLPTRDGYTFTGWYEADGHQAVSPLAEDLDGQTLEAHWTANSDAGEVSFYAGGAALNNTAYVAYDGTKTPTTASQGSTAYVVPVAAGDTLASWQVPVDSIDADANQYDWYTSATGGEKADTTKLAAGSKVYLQKTVLNGYTVTFTVDGDPNLLKDDFAGDVKTTYRVEKGAKLTAPEGWYYKTGNTYTVPAWTDAAGNTIDQLNDDKGVQADLTFTASDGTTPVHLVTFKDYAGPSANTVGSDSTKQKVLSVVDGATVNSVKRFAAPKDTKENKFDGFYTEEGLINKANLDSSVKANVDLFASWTNVQDVKVTFDLNYDNAPAATVVTVKQNSKVAKPADPTRKGYVFKKWYLSTDSTKADAFANDTFKAGTATVTLLAYWQSEEDAALESVAVYRGDNAKVNGVRPYDVDSFDAYKTVYDKYFTAPSKVGDLGTLKKGANQDEAIKAVQKALDSLVETADAKLYRVYNPGNGDHYFTTSADQQSRLVNLGWRAEGAPYKVVNDRTVENSAGDNVVLNLGTAVYSVYNPNTGEHLLVQEFEADALAKAGWVKEQIQFYVPQGATKDVYRVYNPNTNGPAHVYVSKGEATGLVAQGWRWDFGGKVAYKLG